MGTFGVPHDVDHNIRPKLESTAAATAAGPSAAGPRGLAPCEFELQCLSDGCGSLLPALEPTTLYVRLQLC